MTPVLDRERRTTLDVLRGVALFGVLWVNLLTLFRVSLFEHLITFHTHPGVLNEWIDLVTAWLIEFKAFTVFSFLFGVGIAIQTERTTLRGTRTSRFLLRRFAILLVIGIIHMFLIWNGDILCLYAVCGWLIIPVLRLPTRLLVCLGVAAIAFNFAPVCGALLPSDQVMRVQAAASTPIYANGSFPEILALRWRETWSLIVPLLGNALPRTFGLMLLGLAAWRTTILKQPAGHRRFLTIFFVAATSGGALATSLIFWSASTGKVLSVPAVLVEALSYAPLALGLASGLTLWLSYAPTGRLIDLLAAYGRMALTNYLVQSVVFSLIFYGYGLQLFGKLSPTPAATIGVVVFTVQLIISFTWLRAFHFGPVEWLWRSLTYGGWQQMRRTEGNT